MVQLLHDIDFENIAVFVMKGILGSLMFASIERERQRESYHILSFETNISKSIITLRYKTCVHNHCLNKLAQEIGQM